MKTLKKLVLIALLAAGALVVQLGLSALPNVELVTLWFLIIAQTFKFKDNLLIIFVFTLLEALVWGFGDWVIGYLWIWALWVVLVAVLKPINKDHAHAWALTGAFFGLMFGVLFSLQHALLYGWGMGVVYYIRGIPFDVIHAFSNYTLILLLYTPLSKTFASLLTKWRFNA